MRPTLRPAGASLLIVEGLPICWWLPPPKGCSTGCVETGKEHKCEQPQYIHELQIQLITSSLFCQYIAFRCLTCWPESESIDFYTEQIQYFHSRANFTTSDTDFINKEILLNSTRSKKVKLKPFKTSQNPNCCIYIDPVVQPTHQNPTILCWNKMQMCYSESLNLHKAVWQISQRSIS